MLYDIHKSYEDNVLSGPKFSDPIPMRIFPPKVLWKDFLGFKVASQIGVPAGPLLTAQWTTLAARLGFDIVTYKTIRSHAHAGHPLPNILYVKTEGPIEEGEGSLVQSNAAPDKMQDLAITNSFGMPSQSPEFLEKDIARANSELAEGQILVVSVFGSPKGIRDCTQDFVETALFAKNSGAKIIEANFSCPNIKSGHSYLYTDPETVFEIGSKICKALKTTPLIIKVGLFPNRSILKKVLISAALAGIRAVSGINTISKKVNDSHGRPALGPDRHTSGICGAPIKNIALEFIRDAREIIDNEHLPLTLIGVGGIVITEDFDEFFDAGADFAQSATGMMWNPYLAMEYHAQHRLASTAEKH